MWLASTRKSSTNQCDPAQRSKHRDAYRRISPPPANNPHHIRSFFEAAFAQAGGVLRPRESGRAEITRVPAIVRDRHRLIGRGDPVLPCYNRVCFDKAQSAGREQAALIAPGHPRLDAVVDVTLERYRNVLTRGAVLVDENNQHERMQVLMTFRHAVCDGRTTRHGNPQTISERLRIVWLDDEGRAGDGGPAPHLDCGAVREEEQAQVAELLKAPWLGEALEDRARTIAMTKLVPRHLGEKRERRLPELDRIEAAVKERMRREIVHFQHRAIELEAEEHAGKKPRLNSANVRRQCDALTDRLRLRLAEVARQRDIGSLPPEVCGMAFVVPAQLLHTNKGRRRDDRSGR